MSEISPGVGSYIGAWKTSGGVKRWHTEETIREQTLADHRYNLLRIYMSIWGTPTGQILWKIVHHDFEELFLGDLPHWSADILELKNGYRTAEEKLLALFPKIKETQSPTAHDRRIKICDWIEALEFMMREILLGNKMMTTQVHRLYGKLVHEMSDYNEEIEKYLEITEFKHNYNLLMDGVL